jgi:hypothetical protein
MEAFHLLSRGGVNFDKKRFKKDVELFTGVRWGLQWYSASLISIVLVQ